MDDHQNSSQYLAKIVELQKEIEEQDKRHQRLLADARDEIERLKSVKMPDGELEEHIYCAAQASEVVAVEQLGPVRDLLMAQRKKAFKNGYDLAREECKNEAATVQGNVLHCKEAPAISACDQAESIRRTTKVIPDSHDEIKRAVDMVFSQSQKRQAAEDYIIRLRQAAKNLLDEQDLLYEYAMKGHIRSHDELRKRITELRTVLKDEK